jgi:hypothetical protein
MYANQGFGSEAWLQNGKVLGTPFCPIYIGPLILKMAKHVVMSMHVCVCCANKLILIVVLLLCWLQYDVHVIVVSLNT